jgi:sec-independent protein translocase protein TatA
MVFGVGRVPAIDRGLLGNGVFMGGLSIFHWALIAIVVLVLFGNRLPSVMRSLGQGVVEFKKGLQGIEDDVNKSPAGRIAEEPAKPQAKEETKAAETEPAAK